MQFDLMMSGVLFFPLALIIGIGASAIGFTAWMIMVPILFVVFGFDIYLAIFLSLIIDLGNAAVMSAMAFRKGEHDIKRAAAIITVSIPFIALGVYAGTFFIPQNQEYFKGSIGVMNFVIG